MAARPRRHRANRLVLEQLLKMTAPPRGLDLRPGGDPPRDAEEPAPDRLATTDRAGLAHQDQEGGLEGVVGVVRVAQELPADAQDHGPVSFDQDGEGGLRRIRIVPRQKPVQELAIGQGPGRTQLVEHGELIAQDGARSCMFHSGSPSVRIGETLVNRHNKVPRHPAAIHGFARIDRALDRNDCPSRPIALDLNVTPILDFARLDSPPVLVQIPFGAEGEVRLVFFLT